MKKIISILVFLLFITACGKVDKCANVSCEDGNLCTSNACNRETGKCGSSPVLCEGDQTCNPSSGICEKEVKEAKKDVSVNTQDELLNEIDELIDESLI